MRTEEKGKKEKDKKEKGKMIKKRKKKIVKEKRENGKIENKIYFQVTRYEVNLISCNEKIIFVTNPGVGLTNV